jgi:SAM-dependent methyltransferase
MPAPRPYWTHEIFVSRAPLFGAILERAKATAGEEARGIHRILRAAGAPRRARVLDIACGIGRHVVPLAQLGCRTVGSDFSPTYLAEARRYAEREHLRPEAAHFYRSDYRRIDRTLRAAREPPFDAAISIFTSMGHYGERGDLTTLRAVRRVVRPGGLFLMEMGNRDWILAHYAPTGTMEGRDDLWIQEARRFDWETSTARSDWTFYRGRGRSRRKLFEQEIQVRLYSLHELKSLFERAGWEFVRSFGGLTDPHPIGPESRRLVVLGRRPVRAVPRSRSGRARSSSRPTRRARGPGAPSG